MLIFCFFWHFQDQTQLWHLVSFCAFASSIRYLMSRQFDICASFGREEAGERESEEDRKREKESMWFNIDNVIENEQFYWKFYWQWMCVCAVSLAETAWFHLNFINANQFKTAAATQLRKMINNEFYEKKNWIFFLLSLFSTKRMKRKMWKWFILKIDNSNVLKINEIHFNKINGISTANNAKIK